MWELFQNEEALRRADERGELRPPKLEDQSYLYKGNNPNTQRSVYGLYSVADAVQAVLVEMGMDLGSASDEDVKIALRFVLQEGSPTFCLMESISEKATFTWLGRYRRLSKDYEELPQTTEAWVYAAMTGLMLRRLAHSIRFLDTLLGK